MGPKYRLTHYFIVCAVATSVPKAPAPKVFRGSRELIWSWIYLFEGGVPHLGFGDFDDNFGDRRSGRGGSDMSGDMSDLDDDFFG